MKTHIKNGFEYFYDRNQKLWVLYPVDESGNRIEWDQNDNPIESQYFNNRNEVNDYLSKHKNNGLQLNAAERRGVAI